MRMVQIASDAPPARLIASMPPPDYLPSHRSRSASELPRVIAMAPCEHPYLAAFYDSCRSEGMTIIQGMLAGRWLAANVRAGDVLHWHWPGLDYLHTNPLIASVRFIRLAALMLAMRLRGARIVWTAHNLYPHDPAWLPGLDRWARRFVVAISEHVFVHGPAAARQVAERLKVPTSKLVIIEHGHWIGRFPDSADPATARTRLQLPQKADVVLFIGLCKPYKNVLALIDAFSTLDKDTPPGTRERVLVIAGAFQDPHYQATVEAAVAAVPNVRLVPGYVPENELQWYFAAADAVVLPYREILTSGAVMLALGFGRPVVAPRLGGLVDAIDDQSGILYEPGNPSALVEAIRESLRRKWSADRIRDQARRFSWQRAAMTYAAVLRTPSHRGASASQRPKTG